MDIILGSQSPRRKEILSFFDIPFTQIKPDFCEEDVPFQGNPGQYASTLSEGKSLALSQKHSDAIIITADTVVFRNGKSYGKPQNETQAYQDLAELVGNWHSVFTAVTVRNAQKVHTGVEETKVLFNPASEENIRSYQQNIHCADKAGGYAIQAAGSIIVRQIEGCYYNVLGLPINTLRELLLRLGIDLWQKLRK